MNMERVREYSEEFMEKEYPDEAPYFYIAWEVFEEILKDGGSDTRDFGKIVVRFEGDDTIMAPMAIRAFYIIFSEIGEQVDSFEDTAKLSSSVLKLLLENKFSPEFSAKIADFILEKNAQ